MEEIKWGGEVANDNELIEEGVGDTNADNEVRLNALGLRVNMTLVGVCVFVQARLGAILQANDRKL